MEAARGQGSKDRAARNQARAHPAGRTPPPLGPASAGTIELALTHPIALAGRPKPQELASSHDDQVLAVFRRRLPSAFGSYPGLEVRRQVGRDGVLGGEIGLIDRDAVVDVQNVLQSNHVEADFSKRPSARVPPVRHHRKRARGIAKAGDAEAVAFRDRRLYGALVYGSEASFVTDHIANLHAGIAAENREIARARMDRRRQRKYDRK